VDPPRLDLFLKCAAQCGNLRDTDRAKITAWMVESGCDKYQAKKSKSDR
jgi:hypothetical protein